MKYTVILNGCSDNFIAQTEEINGFLSENIHMDMEGRSVIFYSDDSRKQELAANSPTICTLMVKVEKYHPETILDILNKLEAQKNADLYLFSSDYAGNELSVRFAYRMSGCSLVSVNKIEPYSEELLCYKMIYSNHMQGMFKLNKKPFCISISKGCSDRKPVSIAAHDILEVDMTRVINDNFIEFYELTKQKQANGLDTSKFLIIAGRGVKKKERLEMLETIAEKIGADLGVSRPVAMNAWTSMNKLVGVSGVMTKPEVCIAVGVSGAAALYAGIEKSKYIIAVNTDEKSSIVKNSDAAIIDDYQNVLEELVKLIHKGGVV